MEGEERFFPQKLSGSLFNPDYFRDRRDLRHQELFNELINEKKELASK